MGTTIAGGGCTPPPSTFPTAGGGGGAPSAVQQVALGGGPGAAPPTVATPTSGVPPTGAQPPVPSATGSGAVAGASGGGALAAAPAAVAAPIAAAAPPAASTTATASPDLGALVTQLQGVVQALQGLVATLTAQAAAGGGPGAGTGGVSGGGASASACSMGGETPGKGVVQQDDGSATTPPPSPTQGTVTQDVDAKGKDATAKASPTPPAAPGQILGGKYHLGNLTPNQLTDGTGLSKDDGESACGPAAAVALARFEGKDLDLGDVTRTAKDAGLWTQADGMGGPAAEAKLLKKIGVKATQVDGDVDWDRVKKSVQAGKPVIIGTPGHYWVAEKYDEKTGKFDFGKSGSVFKAAHGNTMYKPSELHINGGGEPRVAFYPE